MTESKDDFEAIVARLRARLAARGVSPLPWIQGTHVAQPCALVSRARPRESLLGLDREGMAIVFQEPDAALIAEAVSALPALLDRLAAAEADAAAVRAAARRVREVDDGPCEAPPSAQYEARAALDALLAREPPAAGQKGGGGGR